METKIVDLTSNDGNNVLLPNIVSYPDITNMVAVEEIDYTTETSKDILLDISAIDFSIFIYFDIWFNNFDASSVPNLETTFSYILNDGTEVALPGKWDIRIEHFNVMMGTMPSYLSSSIKYIKTHINVTKPLPAYTGYGFIMRAVAYNVEQNTVNE
ncbi:MAG: hypothetical protein KBT35_01215 [Firmicutes bacterium]|nr:hypothetical protein [Candidatus Colivicinus equi]